MRDRPLKVFLGDLSYITEGNRHNLYTPINIGYVASYAAGKFGQDIGLGLTKSPKALFRMVKEHQPEIVGLSLYYWNAALVRLISENIKNVSPETFIVLGGPCIDVDKGEQQAVFNAYPHVDAIIPNEGEQGFANLTERLLSGSDQEVVPGATIRGGAAGAPIGLGTDLMKVPSPYLMGLMDPFLDGICQPLIQTSRLCPYTCAFCVSGKDRGKLRAFPLEVVNAEIEYICKKFQGSRETLFYLTDENFGILERDLEVADMILAARAKFNYPNRIFYYNDKRFTQISRDLHEKVGDMCWHGVCLSLQSENPEALKAIKRRNLTDEQIVSALAWAKNLKLKTSTELIFGLPGETLESFLNLIDKCVRFGFEVINCYNLMLFRGIEMNRPKYREEHKLETSRRFRYIDDVMGVTIAETDEIVISADTFTKEDFVVISKVGALLSMIYNGLYQKELMELVSQGHSLTKIILNFLTPLEGDDVASRAHRAMLWVMEEQIFSPYENKENFVTLKKPPDPTLASEENLPKIMQAVVTRYMSTSEPTRSPNVT
jgi:radical SAM superfamily enzyme YgiQ (UPF0313 family)